MPRTSERTNGRAPRRPPATDPAAERRAALFAAAPRDRVAADLALLAKPLSHLRPDPDNARLHPERNLLDIMESLAKFGQLKPIVVREQTGVVVAGNGTLEAARRLGWSLLAAVEVPLTDAEAANYGLADNRTAETSRWDEEVVARLERLVSEAGDEVVGWSRDEILAMRARHGNPHPPQENGGGGGRPQETGPAPQAAPTALDVQYNVMVECDSEAEQLELLGILVEQGHKCRALTS